MRNLWILLLLIALLVGYGLLQRYWAQSRPSFRTELLQIDTAAVDLLQITDLSTQTEFLIRRLGNRWLINQANVNTPADQAAINHLLGSLVGLETRYLAEAEPKRWKVYELAAGQGTRLGVYVNNQLQEAFIIGTNYYNRQTETAVSYVRLDGQREVYAVDGERLNRKSLQFDRVIDKRVLTLDPATVTQFSVQLADSTYVFTRQKQHWLLNAFLPLREKPIRSFLHQLADLKANTLATDFDELQADSLFHHRLIVETTDPTADYQISCYRDSTRQLPFIIHSSQYPDSWWATDSSSLFQAISPDWLNFLPLPAAMPQ